MVGEVGGCTINSLEKSGTIKVEVGDLSTHTFSTVTFENVKTLKLYKQNISVYVDVGDEKSRSLQLNRKNSGKFQLTARYKPDPVTRVLATSQAVIGWGGAGTPHDQRADWLKGHVNSDTVLAGSQ